ncbi:MAG TPA: radical SAM protein [Candidatus Acidoferrales bacterium]|nr:radical SAM protein [Candidatus Acidoferrales bacterium]
MDKVMRKNDSHNPKIVLTTDETMMSNYRGGMFVGFSTCMPQGILPDWFFFRVWSPPVPRKNGRALYSDFGLRLVEASLAKEFGENEVAVVHPYDLEGVVGSRTDIIAINGHDFLGINPPTSEFVDLIDTGPPYNRLKFFELMRKPIMKEKVVVAGGKAAWQLADEAIMDKLNIDYVHLGEGELTIPQMFKSIIDGEKLPRIIEGKTPSVEEIPNIIGATIHGLVEIGRGCGRGCSFCTPNMLKFVCKSIDHIERDVKTNVAAGQSSILLHSEDVLRYGADGMTPNKERVLTLFKRVASVEGVNIIGTSHVALATVYHNADLVKEISETCYSMLPQDWIGAQTGIETGSEQLLAKYMKNKALPSSAAKWREIVTQAFGILDDNKWVCAATMINGLPGETTDDVVKSIELVEELKKSSTLSLVIPMNFVSMCGSVLDSKETFTIKKMTPEHWQLLGECLEHDLNVVPKLFRFLDSSSGGFIKNWLFYFTVKNITNGLKKYAKSMKRGEPPISRTNESTWLNPDIPDFNSGSCNISKGSIGKNIPLIMRALR